MFEFIYSGNQSFSNQLNIYNASNNSLVYNLRQTTFKLEHVLIENSLINGNLYNAELIVYDQYDTASATSDRIQFMCFNTPSFSISNLMPHQIVRNSSFEIELSYSQPEGELLNEFYVVLYDLNHKEISKSPNFYLANGMTFQLVSLLDNQNYFVKAFGSTVNGMLIETEEINFSVEYINAAHFSIVSLENLPKQGAIKTQSNMILIDGESNPDPPIYLNNEKVDLTNDNSWVRYTKGFNISSDFLIEIICENIKLNKTFFYLNNGDSNNSIALHKCFGIFDNSDNRKSYIVLNVRNKHLTYRITSNTIDELLDNELVAIVVKRTKNLYSISLERKV